MLAVFNLQKLSVTYERIRNKLICRANILCYEHLDVFQVLDI